MSQMITTKDLTEDYLTQLKDICKKATQVVGWYAHAYDATVRGPFCRWFHITPVAPEYEKYVGTIQADADFAAHAMSAFPALLELIDEKDAKIKQLKQEMVDLIEGRKR